MDDSLLGCTSVESRIESDGSAGSCAAVRTKILYLCQILVEDFLYSTCLLKTAEAVQLIGDVDVF